MAALKMDDPAVLEKLEQSFQKLQAAGDQVAAEEVPFS